MPKPQSGNYRCEATMSDGSTGVLFYSGHSESTPGAALQLALSTWREQGQEPVTVRIYAGGRDKAEGRVLAQWGKPAA